MNLSLAHQNLSLENGRILERSPHRMIAVLSTMAVLAVFEAVNFSTTSFALRSLFGSLPSGGMSWISLFALAICCMDIAGITCLFLPAIDPHRPGRDRYLFIAWFLTAGLNTWLTWRGISLAIAIRQAQIGWVVNVEVLTRTLPVFLAFLIWLIRVMIIGSISHSTTSTSEPDFNIGKSRFFDEGSEKKETAPFRMPPHEAVLPFDPFIQPAWVDPVKHEPTYRGIPVRYKTL